MHKIQRIILSSRNFGKKYLIQCQNQLFRRHYSEERTLPKLFYVQSPFRWLRCKYHFQLLKYAWDLEFCEREFKRGAKQACFKALKVIRNEDIESARQFTTKKGFYRLLKDLEESRNDPRLSLMLFRVKDFSYTVPVKIQFYVDKKERHCFVDVYFIAMRYLDEILYNAANSNDKFSSNDMKLLKNIEKIENDLRALKKIRYPRNIKISDKIVMAELFLRFHCNFTMSDNQNWLIEFLKVSDFDLLYRPSASKVKEK